MFVFAFCLLQVVVFIMSHEQQEVIVNGKRTPKTQTTGPLSCLYFLLFRFWAFFFPYFFSSFYDILGKGIYRSIE
jgi:hypothetical protein